MQIRPLTNHTICLSFAVNVLHATQSESVCSDGQDKVRI